MLAKGHCLCVKAGVGPWVTDLWSSLHGWQQSLQPDPHIHRKVLYILDPPPALIIEVPRDKSLWEFGEIFSAHQVVHAKVILTMFTQPCLSELTPDP